MKIAMTWVLTVAVSAGALACSSSHSSGPTDHDSGPGTGRDGGDSSDEKDTGAVVTVASFCASLTTAEAAYAARCYGGEATLWADQIASSSPCAQLESAVTAGRVAFDVTSAASCLSAYATEACATVATSDVEPAACKSTLAGTVHANGTCYANIDCAGTSFCSGLGGATGSCAGTCTAKVAAGATCGTGDECVSGYDCATAICTASKTPAAKGDTCVFDKTTKAAAPACGTGLVCDLSLFVCVTPSAEGATCPPGHSVCAPFTYCDPSSTTCKQNPAVGEKCGFEKGEDNITCLGQAYCAPVGTTTAGTCVAQGAAGAACAKSTLTTAGDQCQSGVCRVGDAGGGSCSAPCEQD